jgi:PAS domain S-box-containing protein
MHFPQQPPGTAAPPARRSLARRLSLSVGLSSAVLSIVALGLVAGLFIQRSFVHMGEHALRSAAFLAESVEYPLWNLDLNAVKAIGQALVQDHVVGLVEVAGPKGEKYYHHQTEHRILLDRRVDVVHEGQVIGSVRVGLNDIELQATVWPVVLTGAGLAALIILLQYLLHALFFRPLLRQPFSSLDRLITAYSSGDFSPAPPQAPYAEFAPLFRLLVDMGGTIRRQMDDLKASEERLSLALDAANDGMWDWDVASGTTHFSPRYFTMLGYAPGEFAPTHESFQNLLHPGDREHVEEALFAALGGQPYETEFRLRDKSGQWRWVLSRGRVVERDDAGRPRRMVGTHMDITARKELELRLADQLAFQQALMDTVPYAVFYKGADTRFLGFNTAYEEMFGVRRGDLLGKRVLDLEYLPAADRVAYQAEDEAVIASAGRVQKEMPIPFADGRVHQTLYSVNGFRSADGAPGGLIGVIVDITERKQAEAALAASEKKYRAIFDTAPVGIFRTSFQGQLLDANPAMARMLAYASREELLASVHDLATDVYPSLEARQRFLENMLASPGGLSMEIELKRKDGTPIYTIINASLLFDAEGKPAFLTGTIKDITERKQAEAALAASEKRFRTLFEVAQDSILVVDNGRAVDCNHSAEVLLGRTREEIIGKYPAELSPPRQPDGRDSFQRQDEIHAITASGEKLLFDWTFARPDGSPVWAEVSLQSIGGDAPHVQVGVIRDVTERRRAEEMLRQSEEKFSRLFLLSPDNVALNDLETGRFVEVNESFLRFHGRTREQVIGHSVFELGFYVDPNKRKELVAAIRTRGSVDNFEFEIRRGDGAVRTGSMSAQMVEIGGRHLLMSILRDITDLKRMQEVMVQTEKMISVGGIAAGVAHEINNPLGIVLHATQNLIQRTRPDHPKNIAIARDIGLDLDKLRQYVQVRKLDVFIEDIRSAAVRAAAIIRHMLDFSRRSESKRSACDLPAIVRKAIGLAQSDYDLKKSYDFKMIQVDVMVEDDLPPVTCTETEIEQVILNLLRNAAQAMAEAQPPVATPRIGIRLATRPGAVRIEVEDNGPGIPPEVQRRVFEPFFTTKPPGVGTGLGLSVSYFIVTKGHGGKMGVESTPGKGTLFTIDLPTEDARR